MSRARPVTTPKDIQQGTANHVQMMINYLEAGGPENANEALMLAVDLLDQLVGDSPALVVTQRVAPLDAKALADARKAGYEAGLVDGAANGASKARRDVLERLTAFLQS